MALLYTGAWLSKEIAEDGQVVVSHCVLHTVIPTVGEGKESLRNVVFAFIKPFIFG